MKNWEGGGQIKKEMERAMQEGWRQECRKGGSCLRLRRRDSDRGVGPAALARLARPPARMAAAHARPDPLRQPPPNTAGLAGRTTAIGPVVPAACGRSSSTGPVQAGPVLLARLSRHNPGWVWRARRRGADLASP